MADKLIFPIGFDLEGAVKEAQGNADKLLRRLETTIKSRPLAINLKITNAGAGSINEINSRMAALVKRWNELTEAERIANKTSGEYTAEAKKILAEYTRLMGASESYARTLGQIATAARRSANEQEKMTAKQRAAWEKLRKTISANENTIDALNAKIKAYQQRLNGLEVGSRKFEKTAEKIKQLSQRLDEAKRKVAELTGKMPKTATAVNQVSEAFKEQDDYVSRLLKHMAVYAAYSGVNNFLRNVRETTAQFELQRVSLGAIIQDQQKANQIFAEIKSFALTSPLKILDLTKYAKQVAAYGFAADQVFDVTKRLADISVGLGVDMGRLTLAVSQIKAATALKASELRQLTETGLPMLDLLSKKLTETQGKIVTTADVMDLISKCAISYEMVEEILYDLTDAGGMFYNTQIKQSQTLFGMWSKLGDAAASIYDQIGNTSSVNSGMKMLMQTIEQMMRNWKTTARWLDVIAGSMITYVVVLKSTALATTRLTGVTALLNLAHQQQVIQTPKIVAAIIGQNAATKISTVLTKAHTGAVLRQATATNLLTKGFWKLTAAMLANPWVAAAAAIAGVALALFHFIGNTETATERAEKLNNSVASLKNLDDTITPLIDTYNELINKTERTAEEEKKLSEVTHELAKRYPGAITAIGDFGNEVDLATDKLNKLYQAEKQARMDNTRYELGKTEAKIKETEAEIEKLDQRLIDGTKTVYKRLGDSGLRTKKIVPLTDEDKGKIIKQVDELRANLYELKNAATEAKRSLGLIPSEAVQAIEKFGAWKKTFTTFRKQVGDVRVQLFDDSTINQFGSLEEALKKTAEEYKKNIALVKTYEEVLNSANLNAEERAKVEAEKAKADAMATLAKNALEYYNALSLLDTTSGGGNTRQSDDRLSKLQEILSTLEKINTKYEELSKKEGDTKALEDINEMYANTLAYANKLGEQFGLKFEMPTDFKDLQQYRKAILGVINTLKMKGYEKAALDLEEKIGTGDIDKLQKKIEAELKTLADRISRTKTAKEFYEKILSQTGDVELAANLAVSVYGQNGGSLKQEIASQLTNALKGVTADGQTIGENVWAEGIIDPTTAYVNYKKLRELLDKVGDTLPEKQKQILNDMLKNGEAYNKSQVEQWAKDLAKVKDYTDQYIDLYRLIEQRKAEIRQKMKSGELSEEAGNQEIAGYDSKLAKEQQKIQYEAFKNSPMYTTLFENMENATVQSLQNMRKQIEKMMSVTKEPTQLKELQSRLNEIDETLAEKSPFEVIAKGWQTMGEMAEKYGTRSHLDDLVKQKQAELDALQSELDTALAKEAESKRFAEMMGVDVQNPVTAITPVQKAALSAYQQASASVKKYSDAVKKADEEQQKLTSDVTKWANAMGKVKGGLKTIVQIGQKLLEASEAATEFAEALGMSEDGLVLFQDINNVISQTLSFADSLIGCIDLLATTTAASISTVEKASVILTAISMALKLASAITNLIVGSKVRKANKEIERQQELLDQLEYTYSRLEKAADKVFGVDYISNYNQQIQLLQAQQAAYLKQAEAERSKGKDEDEAKTKEYLDKARDAADQIADMQGKIAEQMTGTDVASAARDFANAWLEAYASFGNTTAAIKDKFKEMIKNMVVESVMARVVQQALQPMFDEMNKMYQSGASTTEVLKYALTRGATLAEEINSGLLSVARESGAAGVNLKELFSSADDVKGISREFATASESSINGLAAMYDTNNYYASKLPNIDANVAMIRQLMESRNVSLPKSSIDTTALWNQHLELQQGIHRHTAETVNECKRIAEQCTAMAADIHKVIVPKNQTGAYKVYVGM